MRYDFPLLAPLAFSIRGNVLRYTVSSLVGAAIYKAIFSPLPVPARFGEEFPHGFVVRPSQIRAESQDPVTMIPGASGMADGMHDFRLPVTIMAGDDDRIVGHEDYAVWPHDQIPGSTFQIIPEVGHMLHYAVPSARQPNLDSKAKRFKTL